MKLFRLGSYLPCCLAFWFIAVLAHYAGHANAQSSSVAPRVLPCCQADGALGVRWIVNAGTLHHAVSAIPMEQQQRYFGTPCTFMVGKLKAQPYSQWNSIGTVSIRSATVLESCCDEGVGAVMYDPEKWQFTPDEERRNPGEYACKIAAIVHAHHRLLIVAPAADLVGGGPDRFDRFLRAKIAGSVAKCADVYEIQAQDAELDMHEFQSYVREGRRSRRGPRTPVSCYWPGSAPIPRERV
ncbi:MAG: hypothetical protein WBX19_18950 [Terracidiphilus sp.]